MSPSFGDEVRLYICGITPYDSAHLGHAFTFLTYDVLQRYLEQTGKSVKIVRNITDVDEPIYVRARQLRVHYMDLANEETAKFQNVMAKLNIKTPFAEPRASDYIEKMAIAIQQLLDNDKAYRLKNGDIYYAVAKDPKFGKQSHLSKHLQQAFMANRGGDPGRADKNHPFDFLLWKAIDDPADPAQWASVVGNGRPGWHIECTVMSSDILGVPFDLHGGGMDLIFPHHEAESAQARGLGHPVLAHHWMHVAPMSHYGENMSKSLGNLVFVADLLEKYDADVIRLALLGYHYRVGGEWVASRIDDAKLHMHILQHARSLACGVDPAPYLKRFYDLLEDDFNIPEAIFVTLELASNSLTTENPKHDISSVLDEMLNVLGLTSLDESAKDYL